ncbi:hypothetical protein P7K49_025982, partial [Saguinus oedipus]
TSVNTASSRPRLLEEAMVEGMMSFKDTPDGKVNPSQEETEEDGRQGAAGPQHPGQLGKNYLGLVVLTEPFLSVASGQAGPPSSWSWPLPRAAGTVDTNVPVLTKAGRQLQTTDGPSKPSGPSP